MGRIGCVNYLAIRIESGPSNADGDMAREVYVQVFGDLFFAGVLVVFVFFAPAFDNLDTAEFSSA